MLGETLSPSIFYFLEYASHAQLAKRKMLLRNPLVCESCKDASLIYICDREVVRRIHAYYKQYDLEQHKGKYQFQQIARR